MPRATRARTRGALKERPTAASENVQPTAETVAGVNAGVKAVGAVSSTMGPAGRLASEERAAEVEARRRDLDRDLADLDAELEERCATLRQAAEDFATELRKELRVQLIKIPKKIRVLSLKQFSEDFGRDISKELLRDINARAGLPEDANAAETTTGHEDDAPVRQRVRRYLTDHEPFVAARARPLRSEMPPPSTGARGRRGRAAGAASAELEAKGAATGLAAMRTTRKRGRPAAAPPDAVAPMSTRRSARAAAAAAAAADDAHGTVLAQTPANKRAAKGTGGGVQFAVPVTPQGTGKTVGFAAGCPMSVAKTPGTVRVPRRGEELYSKNGSPLGVTTEMEGSDGEADGGIASRLLSSVRKVRETASAMKSGRKKRGTRSSSATPAGGVMTAAAEELGNELKDLADMELEGGAESVEQAVGALQSLQSQVAAAMARLLGGKK